MTHTKGPWRVSTEPTLYTESEIAMIYCTPETTRKDGTKIRYTTINATYDDSGTQEDKQLANALLLAASPELLEALEVIVRNWDGEEEDMFAAIQAIAKAKGKKT